MGSVGSGHVNWTESDLAAAVAAAAAAAAGAPARQQADGPGVPRLVARGGQ